MLILEISSTIIRLRSCKKKKYVDYTYKSVCRIKELL